MFSIADPIDNKNFVSPPNLCKFLPKSIINYINMQTVPCPLCSLKGNIYRCDKYHLENFHNIIVEDIYYLINTIIEDVQALKKACKTKKDTIKRKDVLQRAEDIIKPSLQTLKTFLNGF